MEDGREHDSVGNVDKWFTTMPCVSMKFLIPHDIWARVHDNVELPMYEGFPELYAFLMEFKENVS